jgi:hypothetical protein
MSAAVPSAPRIPAEGDALNKIAFDITLRAVEDRLLEHDPSLAVASAAEVPAGVLEWLKTRPPPSPTPALRRRRRQRRMDGR